MGVKSRTMHGSRAQLAINGVIVGIFNSVEYGVTYDAQAVSILGRFNAAEIVLTGMEPISITASGFRVVDNGPYKVASVPKLQELLNHEDITVSIYDRQDPDKEIMTVVGVRPTGYSTQLAARGLQGLTVNFLGLALSDEEGAQEDEQTAVNYPV